jgi:hypothetical protein
VAEKLRLSDGHTDDKYVYGGIKDGVELIICAAYSQAEDLKRVVVYNG